MYTKLYFIYLFIGKKRKYTCWVEKFFTDLGGQWDLEDSLLPANPRLRGDLLG
jgi:hypothetical protein